MQRVSRPSERPAVDSRTGAFTPRDGRGEAFERDGGRSLLRFGRRRPLSEDVEDHPLSLGVERSISFGLG